MPLADLLASVDHPFPGLRPFETAESLLFFGREDHTEELLRRLAGGRFLAVVGTSGSGKSSLVRAGLLPALYRGYLVGSTTHWRIAVMRPGSAPIQNLCAALAHPDALGELGEADHAARLAQLQSSSLGLVEVVRAAKLAPGESLLIVADQFEELFRYHRQPVAGRDAGSDAGSSAAEASSGAALFVSLLLQAAERFDCPVYVVLTMRSDFLGDCSQFPGLPDALSRSQYLIPRLTREQRQQAIERPLQLAGIGIAQPLIQQLLIDSGNDAGLLNAAARGGTPDPLPVLQHALMRTCEHHQQLGLQGDLDIPDYDAVGGIKDALHRHAESIFTNLGAAGQAWAARIFRCLTATEAGRPVRRPTRLHRLYEIAGTASQADRAEVDAVLRSFLDRQNSLLVSSSPEGLTSDAVIDIPHESLIWKWQRLQGWVHKEAVSAEWYVDLVNDACSFRDGESGLWRDPNLSYALKMQRDEGWNQAWAAQYQPAADPSYDGALGFLRQSRTAQNKERWIRRILVGVAVVALVVLLFYWRRVKVAEENSRDLRSQVDVLKSQQEKAQSDAQKYANELARTNASLAGVLSPEDRSKLEKQVLELKDKAEQSQKIAMQAQMQQTQAEKVAAGGGDLKDVVNALRERTYILDTRIKTLEKELSDARSRGESMQDSLDTASREIGRLKLQLAEAIKERDVPRSLPTPAPANMAVDAGPALKPGTVRPNPSDGQRYVFIPRGEFTMGCSVGDNECEPDEKPPHKVELTRGFWIGQTEVTQAAYEKVMKTQNPSTFKGADRPVENVSWDDARKYCEAAGMGLPTEAQWEYAARAGSKAARYRDLDQIAWYRANSKGQTQPVAAKAPNDWGLYDMLGNVWEWVADGYDEKYYDQRVSKDPLGPASAPQRVLRGGSWNYIPRYVRVSFRDGVQPTNRSNVIGFRCAGELR